MSNAILITIETNKMKQVPIEKHSTPQSILFHLLPGIVVGGFYFLARQPVARLGYPSVFAQMLAFALVLVPLELGFLFVQAKKKTGSFNLRDILSYRNSIPGWQYIVWPTLIFIVVGAVFTLCKPVDALLQTRLFYWVPDINSGLDGQYSRPVLIVTYTLFLIFNVFLAPIVEELYFRGYLLPRMQGRLAPLVPQLPLRGRAYLYALDADYQDRWVTAAHLWNDQEEPLRRHDCSYPGELGRFSHRDVCIS